MALTGNLPKSPGQVNAPTEVSDTNSQRQSVQWVGRCFYPPIPVTADVRRLHLKSEVRRTRDEPNCTSLLRQHPMMPFMIQATSIKQPVRASSRRLLRTKKLSLHGLPNPTPVLHRFSMLDVPISNTGRGRLKVLAAGVRDRACRRGRVRAIAGFSRLVFWTRLWWRSAPPFPPWSPLPGNGRLRHKRRPASR